MKTTVDIFGNRYVIQGESDPAYIKNLAEYVDAKMREISSQAASVTSTRVAVMAALNVADELFQKTGAAPASVKNIDDERIESLITRINTALTKGT